MPKTMPQQCELVPEGNTMAKLPRVPSEFRWSSEFEVLYLARPCLPFEG